MENEAILSELKALKEANKEIQMRLSAIEGRFLKGERPYFNDQRYSNIEKEEEDNKVEQMRNIDRNHYERNNTYNIHRKEFDFDMLEKESHQTKQKLKYLEERCDHLLYGRKRKNLYKEERRRQKNSCEMRNELRDFSAMEKRIKNRRSTINTIKINPKNDKRRIRVRETFDAPCLNSRQTKYRGFSFRSELDDELFGSRKSGNEYWKRYDRDFNLKHKAYFDDSSISSTNISSSSSLSSSFSEEEESNDDYAFTYY